MSGLLDPRFERRTHRLALGIEPTDALRRARVAHPLEVAFDAAPGGMPRSDTCRHVLLWRATLQETVDVRVLDAARRFVPRRLSIALPVDTVGRVCRPALFPGAAYDVPAGAVGVRGRVVQGADGPPIRWVRVEARRTTDDAVVGRAHGDDRGEFLLLLETTAAAAAELTLPIEVRLTVFGPDPPSTEPGPADPYADLPLEAAALPADEVELLRPGPDPVLDGTALPGGYAALADPVEVECGLDGLVSVEFVIP